MARKRKLDPYAMLGVARDATDAAIKAAFRTRAKDTHPDHGGDRAEFEAVSRAVSVLKDPAKRAKYDATGEIDDDPIPDNADQAAFNLIGEALAQAIAGDGASLKADVIASLVAHFRNGTEQLGKRIASLQKAKIRADKMRTRFKRKGEGKNMLAAMVGWQLAQIGEAIKTNEQARQSRERAIAILEDYTFTADPPEQVATFAWTGSSTTSAFGR